MCIYKPGSSNSSLNSVRNMTNKQKGNKLKRYMKSLLRLLSKPKDMYVHAMTTCSTHFPTYVDAAAMAFPTPHFTPAILPRSFSLTTTSSTRSSSASGDDDLKRLFMRSRSATRTRAGINRLEFDRGRKPPARMARSFSTGIGRIDEEKPCEFGYDDVNVVVPQIFPRSRSYGRSAARRAF